MTELRNFMLMCSEIISYLYSLFSSVNLPLFLSHILKFLPPSQLFLSIFYPFNLFPSFFSLGSFIFLLASLFLTISSSDFFTFCYSGFLSS